MRKRILFIDDSASMRAIVKTVLEVQYEVTAIKNCYEAINWIEAGNMPDLILTDLNMGQMKFDGYDFVESMRGSFFYKHIPIITISSESNTDKIKLIKEKFGVATTLSKPFKPVDLLDSVQAVLKY